MISPWAQLNMFFLHIWTIYCRTLTGETICHSSSYVAKMWYSEKVPIVPDFLSLSLVKSRCPRWIPSRNKKFIKSSSLLHWKWFCSTGWILFYIRWSRCFDSEKQVFYYWSKNILKNCVGSDWNLKHVYT